MRVLPKHLGKAKPLRHPSHSNAREYRYCIPSPPPPRCTFLPRTLYTSPSAPGRCTCPLHRVSRWPTRQGRRCRCGTQCSRLRSSSQHATGPCASHPDMRALQQRPRGSSSHVCKNCIPSPPPPRCTFLPHTLYTAPFAPGRCTCPLHRASRWPTQQGRRRPCDKGCSFPALPKAGDSLLHIGCSFHSPHLRIRQRGNAQLSLMSNR